MSLLVSDKEKQQIEHWLKRFVELANSHFESGNKKYYEYWKGQVMGICKIIDLLQMSGVSEGKIDTKYYLNQMI